MYTESEPYIFFPIPLVRVCKYVKLYNFISDVLFPILWKTASKYLHLFFVLYHHEGKTQAVRKTYKDTKLKWPLEFANFCATEVA